MCLRNTFPDRKLRSMFLFCYNQFSGKWGNGSPLHVTELECYSPKDEEQRHHHFHLKEPTAIGGTFLAMMNTTLPHGSPETAIQLGGAISHTSFRIPVVSDRLICSSMD